MLQQSVKSMYVYNSLLTLCLLGLVYGGVFKALFVLISINIFDLTILSAVSIMVLLSIKRKYKISREDIYLIILLGLFSSIYMSSLLYSPSSVYGPQKLVGFMGLLFSFVVGLLLPQSAKNSFLSVIPDFSIVIAIAFILIMTSNLQALLNFDFSGLGLVVGEVLGVGVIIALFNPNKSILRRLGILLSISLILFLGARGPFLFLILIGFFVGLVQVGKNFNNLMNIRKKTFYFIIAAISSALILISLLSGTAIFEFLESGFSRFLLFFESDKGSSVTSRMQMILDAIYYIDQSPIFGHGLGSYGLIVYGTDFRAYPHNGVLEVWFEAGILGLISFMAFILMSFFVAMKRKHFALACIIVFLMLNFLKSSSLDELRLLFLVCGLSASFLVAEKEYKN